MPLKFVKNKIRKASGAIAEFGKQFGVETGSYKEGGQLYTYPLSLRSEVNRPVIRFVSYEKDKEPNFVFFPCPPGVSFSEGASYNTVEIGTLGVGTAALVDTAQAIVGDVQAAGGLRGDNVGRTIIDSIKQRSVETFDAMVSGISAGDALNLLKQYLPGGERITDLAGRKAGSIIAPNALQTYQGNDIRSFAFNFKMVAKSATEAKEIDNIHKHFRRSIYGEGASDANLQFLLKYPPIFNIDFLDMATGNPNPYIPKIYSCFLQGFTSTFNPSADMFHRDGAPIEVDCSMTFVESRALNRRDILELEGQGDATLYNASRAGVNEAGTVDNSIIPNRADAKPSSKNVLKKLKDSGDIGPGTLV